MQKVMFAKVELWLVSLLAVLGLIAMMVFGAQVLKAERYKKAGPVAQTARSVAQLPALVSNVLGEDKAIRIFGEDRFAGRPAGWTFPNGKPNPPLPGYVLLSRYDADILRNKIELVRLGDFQTVHEWGQNAEADLKDVRRTSTLANYNNWDNAHFRQLHPVLMPNGDIITKDHYSPMFRLDACTRRLWAQDAIMFHHSTEMDADGNLWAPAVTEPSAVEGVPDDFRDDTVVQVSHDGDILFQRSIVQLLIDNGLSMTMFSNDHYYPDPLHLNDVEPVLADGPYWKRGDVFLNLRNLSMVMLYRPSTDSIVWSKTGPWTSQHDVDIVDDHRIRVYNNDVQDRGGKPVYDGYSDIVTYDFATDSVTREMVDVFEREKIMTFHAGLHTDLPGGVTMIEDSRDARFMIVSADGKVLADFLNRSADGHIYQLGWSRYIEQDYGDRVLAAVTKVDCNE
mgnify:FL=1